MGSGADELNKKDVHTEHCCVIHGCKYGDENCTVYNGIKKQSYVCEYCGDEQFTTNKGRTFSTGAYRDTDENKLDYSRGLSVEVMERYMTYLMVNRKQSDGVMRDFDNWKQGIPVEEYMASLFRHTVDVWKYVQGKHCEPPESSLEDSLCAVMFNSMGMLYEVMRKPSSDGWIDVETETPTNQKIVIIKTKYKVSCAFWDGSGGRFLDCDTQMENKEVEKWMDMPK